MVQNDLLLQVANGAITERPPVWLMRQAGRILPEYRAVRASVSGFVELVTTPDLAAEVTVQPVDILGVDAAILFSDILVIPEAMGLPYELIEKKGPWFPNTITDRASIEKLISGEQAADHLDYVYSAIHKTLERLDQRVPLIGFAGAPWTLFAYMIEGQGSKTFSKAKKFLYQHPGLAHQLLEKITETTIAYLQKKVAAGVHLVQVFDSWAGLLTPALYRDFAAPYIRQIVEAIDTVPVTVFAKGAGQWLDQINQYPCQVIGLDWTVERDVARQQLGKDRVVQGNLDPCFLYAPAEQLVAETTAMLDQLGPHHIANLGHGVYPDTPVEQVKLFIQTVQHYRYS